MAQELKAFTVNMKTLDQDIGDPIIAGGGDANGRILRLVFTQEAATQITPDTKVYLSWNHQEEDIRGLNIFTQVSTKPAIWEITYPQSMLKEGNVQCCIKLIDDVSIVQSVNFIVHVLTDPDDGSHFIVSDDYSVFKQALIDLSSTKDKMDKELEHWKAEYDSYAQDITQIKDTADLALSKAEEALANGGGSGIPIDSVKLNRFE